MPGIASKLTDLIASQVRNYFGNSQLQAVATPESGEVYFYNWMSLIMLANPDFRLHIKVHCNESDVRFLAQAALKGADGAGEESGVVDFMKELTNLLGGTVKRALETSDIKVGLSLPLMIRGFDELFSEKSDDSDYSYITLTHLGLKVIVQVHFEFLNDSAKDQLKTVSFSTETNSSGAFEFL